MEDLLADGFLAIDHPRFRLAELDLFTTRFVPDCMAHRCHLVDSKRERLDACCLYGADATLDERDAVLARADLIRPFLRPDFRDPTGWFDEAHPEVDPEVPRGLLIRTQLQGSAEDSGCVFLQESSRGCALHAAALAHGFSPQSIKPLVCQLFPIAYGEGALYLAEDFQEYSCFGGHAALSVYRAMRETLRSVLGPDLVVAMDEAEKRVPLL